MTRMKTRGPRRLCEVKTGGQREAPTSHFRSLALSWDLETRCCEGRGRRARMWEVLGGGSSLGRAALDLAILGGLMVVRCWTLIRC